MKRVKKILLTGFEPFGGLETNPSYESIKHLDGQTYSGCEIKVLRVPVDDTCGDKLWTAAIRYFPDIVICFGVYFGNQIAIETVANNVDVDGRGPKESFYRTTLPAKRIAKALKDRAIISNEAGKYFCEYLFWHLMHVLKMDDINLKKSKKNGYEKEYNDKQIGGFVHVPMNGISDEDLKVILKESIKEYESRNKA